MQQHFS